MAQQQALCISHVQRCHYVRLEGIPGAVYLSQVTKIESHGEGSGQTVVTQPDGSANICMELHLRNQAAVYYSAHEASSEHLKLERKHHGLAQDCMHSYSVLRQHA